MFRSFVAQAYVRCLGFDAGSLFMAGSARHVHSASTATRAQCTQRKFSCETRSRFLAPLLRGTARLQHVTGRHRAKALFLKFDQLASLSDHRCASPEQGTPRPSFEGAKEQRTKEFTFVRVSDGYFEGCTRAVSNSARF